MSCSLLPLRPTAARLAPAIVLLAVAACAAAAPAAGAAWRLETIAGSDGVIELHDLAFDVHGRGLLSWNGAERDRARPFGAVAMRLPSGGWQRLPEITGVRPADAQIHAAAVRPLLVAREAATTANRRRLVFADARPGGEFGAVAALDDFVTAHWSAANDAGSAIVAWTSERSPFLRVAERAAGEPFAAARELAVGQVAAVAINARGDRVLAWRAGRRLAARVRPAGGEWGDTARFGRITSVHGLRLSALMARNGRAVVTWGATGRPCGAAVRNRAGRWRTRTVERRCGPSAAGHRAAPVLPVADGRGATYVAWTGRARSGRRAVKLARVGPGASRRPLVLSRERGAVLDDVAADPQRALAVTYAAPRPTRRNPLVVATYAAVRRAGASFGRARRLTPARFAARRGSRVAFHPLTGEPVVAVPFLIGLNVAVAAAVGPPG
ncbi:MAG TPA: hypothetical protein VNT54_15440 [Solirubrobacteraceae bacterium]|nr:hypothetical protein [Solirubrobacteraceae bacterium]